MYCVGTGDDTGVDTDALLLVGDGILLVGDGILFVGDGILLVGDGLGRVIITSNESCCGCC